MGAVWLGSLPQVLRDAGQDVIEWPGWEWRSRSTGGYEDVRGIGVHHDANRVSATLEQRCSAAWEADWNRNKPVGALWLHRDGQWVVGAAGATNTQGRGPARKMSRGRVPENQGNLYLLSIEASNNGVGEPWPTVQQDAYVTGVAALVEWLELETTDVMAHWETAPSRKIDPAGPSRFAIGTSSWNMDDFRREVAQQKENDVTPIDPVRIMDTRWNGVERMTPGTRHEFGLGLATEVPDGARVAFVNFTSVNSDGDGYVSFARTGQPIGGTSCLNMAKAITQANMVIVPLTGKSFSVQVYNAATDLICDVFGYG